MSKNTALSRTVITDIQQDARRWARGGKHRIWPAQLVGVNQANVWYDESSVTADQTAALELAIEAYLQTGDWLGMWTAGVDHYLEGSTDRPTEASSRAKSLAEQALAPVKVELTAATAKGRQAAWMGWFGELAGQVRYYRNQPLFTFALTEGERDKNNQEYATIHAQLDVTWEYKDDGPLSYGWYVRASWVVQSYHGELHGSLGPKRDNMLELVFTLVQDQRETGQSTITGGLEFVRACLEVMGERQLVERTGLKGSPAQF